MRIFSDYSKSPAWLVAIAPVLGFPGVSSGKNLPANGGDGFDPGMGRSAGKEMAKHSSILALEIQWTEEPGEL